MPTVKKPKLDNRALVARLQAMGGTWDAETERWIVPTEREGELRRLLEEAGYAYDQADQAHPVAATAAATTAVAAATAAAPAVLDDGEVVEALLELGGEWDAERRLWIVPTEQRAELLRLIGATGRAAVLAPPQDPGPKRPVSQAQARMMGVVARKGAGSARKLDRGELSRPEAKGALRGVPVSALPPRKRSTRPKPRA